MISEAVRKAVPVRLAAARSALRRRWFPRMPSGDELLRRVTEGCQRDEARGLLENPVELTPVNGVDTRR